MRRGLSILLSAVFIITLISSTPVSSVRVSDVSNQQGQDEGFIYLVKVDPTFVSVNQGEFGAYTVQVLRGSDAGQFSVDLSLISGSSLPKSAVTFNPPTINFEQGQKASNSTLKINSHELASGSLKFRVEAATQGSVPSVPPDRALSNPVALIVGAADSSPTQSSNALANIEAGPESVSDSSSPSASSSTPEGGTEQRQVPETKANNPPIAKAGQDQVTKEGDKVLFDGSASTDPDNDALSFSWDQLSPRQPTVKLDTSDVASKIRFVAPDVDRDTTFRFKLVVRDGSGGTSADSINILVKNVEESTSTSTSPQTPPAAEQQTPTTSSNQGTVNHSPTAEAMQTVLVNDGSPLSILLKGNDPDKDDSLTFIIVSAPSHATIAGFDKTSGSLTYIPNVGFTGKDTIKYKVLDSSGAESNEASIVINVESVEEEEQTTSSAAANVSSILAEEDRLKQRQEIVESKLKETRGEKIANQYIVVLKEDSLAAETQSLVDDAKSRGAKVLQEYQKALKGFTVNVPNTEALAAILNNSDVAYAEPDVKVQAFAQTIPTGIDRVDADLSSAVSGDGKGDAVNADIAILDTGIDLTHPDLNVYKHVSFVPGTTTTTGNDDHGHGSMVAGIAAAKDNDWGSVGVAPGARLWSVKVLDSTGTGSLSSVLEGLDFVTSNANELEVADMSFGCENCSSPTLDTAINNAVTAGVTIVAAAGNGAKDASTFSPANHPDVIAVSAIADSDGMCGGQGSSTSAGADDTLASFSNYGPAIDMAAAGVQIYSTTKNGGYSISSGTSMAAPHIAGAAALYMSENPNASPSQVINALKSQSSSSSNNDCDTESQGNGYFTGDKDSNAEPLLNMKVAKTGPSSTTPVPPSTISNDTSTNTNNQDTGNGTAGAPSSVNNTVANGAATTTTNTTNTNVTDSGDNQTANANASVTIASQTWSFVRSIGEGVLTHPTGVAVNPNTGVTYVADHPAGGPAFPGRVVVFSADGSTWTLLGDDPTTFSTIGPHDVAFGPGGQNGEGVLYVTDPGADRVSTFTPTGALIAHNPVASFGLTDIRGIGAGIQHPDFVYVTDPSSGQVAGFHHDFAGHFIGSPEIVSSSIPGAFDTACCLRHPDAPQPHDPLRLYISDNPNGMIQAFGTRPHAPAYQFGLQEPNFKPKGLEVRFDGANQYVIVADSVGTGGGKVVSFVAGSTSATFDSNVASGGSGDGQVSSPEGVGVNLADGNVYVADTGNNRVQVFSSTPAANQPPVAISESISTNEDIAKSFTLNATDANGDSLSYFVEDAPDKGVLSAQNGSIGSELIYTPNSNYNGPDSFTWKANDGQADSNIATISITVSSVNDVPIAFSDAITTNEDTAKSVELDDYAFDDNAPLEYSIVSNATQGTLTLHDSSTGNLTYTPNSNYNGPDSFTWKANDGQVDSNIATMDINVTAVDDPDTTSPEAPTLLSPANQTITNDNTPTFDWTDVNDTSMPITYNLQVNDSSGVTALSAISGADSSTFTPAQSAALADGNYTWHVRAADNAGGGGWDTGNKGPFSSIFSFEVDTTAPTVIFTDPADGQENVLLDQILNATVSEEVSLNDVNLNDVFTLSGPSGQVTGDIIHHCNSPCNNSVFTFEPLSPLEPDQNYTAFLGGTGVQDNAGNFLEEHTWSFTTVPVSENASITITSVNNTSPRWGVDTISVDGNASGFNVTGSDVVNATFGDGSPAETVSIGEDGLWNAIHTYNATATGPRNITAALVGDNGEGSIKATSEPFPINVTKHATSLALAVKNPLVCPDCAYTVFGKLVDTDTASQSGVDGKTISFTGSGVSPTLQSTQTEGVTFSGDSNNNLILTSTHLQMHVGSHISAPPFSHNLALKFTGGSGSSIGLTLTKSNNVVTTKTVLVGTNWQTDFGPNTIKDIAITSVDSSSSSSEFANLGVITTSNLAVNPSEQHHIDFSTNVAQAGSYTTLVVNPGSYFSTGLTQSQDTTGLKVTAAFAGDSAYLGATSPEASYDVDSSASGIGSSTAYANIPADATWTSLKVGVGGDSDVCTQNGVNDVDADKDGICDKWEDPAGGNGNSLTNRFIVCPSKAGFVAIDPDCPAGAAPTKKYNLCITDRYSDVWGGAPSRVICPTKGHKDIYVEIDYMSTHVPSDTAIRNVIKAFGNAPFSGTQDGLGRTAGITLHVVKDDSVTARTPFFVFRDPTSGSQFTDDSFLEVKNLKFGTSAATERGHADWSTHLKTQKRYVYHYGMWINYYGAVGQTCPAPPNGLSSGLGETLGNDFVVSLGCNFKPYGDNPDSQAEQAGTFMHELGHNLNLGHGGALVAGRLPTDYNTNCKPNYLSVMSYTRQMPNSLFTRASWESGFNYLASGVQTALDYSRTLTPTLTESALNEKNGIAAANGRTYNVVYSQTNDASIKLKDDGAVGSAFDFNGIGGADSSGATYPGDLNNMGSIAGVCGASPPPAPPTVSQSHKGFNDWAEINLVWLADTGVADAQDGLVGFSEYYREMQPLFLESIHQNAADTATFIPPPRTDGSTVVKPGATVPLKFQLKDVDGNFVRDAVVTLVAKKGATTCSTCSGSFVYDPSLEQYRFVWKTPSGASAKGVWQISYIQNFNTPSQVLLQGPQAASAGAPYSYTLTLK